MLKTINVLTFYENMQTNLWLFSSFCCTFDSLLSVLSGKPFVVKGADKETFGRLSGLGVPGPFILDL
jgi:hypothetical protein